MNRKHSVMKKGENMAKNVKEIPLRTLEQVQEALMLAKRNGADEAMARLMLRHGRLTDEALLWIGNNYVAVWD